MKVTVFHCRSERVDLAELRGRHGFLTCPTCGEIVCKLDVSDTAQWIDAQVRRKRDLQQSGRLGTRKQSLWQTDESIDSDGLAAELAACAVLCPGSFDRWQHAAERARSNRGCDLPRRWTGLNKSVEVKQTRYCDEQRGYLLVRPPRRTPGEMRAEYIDDAYYVLVVGRPYRFTIKGWMDRSGLILDGMRNPVPIRDGQRECWGIHWSKLRPLAELAERQRVKRPSIAVRMWQTLLRLVTRK